MEDLFNKLIFVFSLMKTENPTGITKFLLMLWAPSLKIILFPSSMLKYGKSESDWSSAHYKAQ